MNQTTETQSRLSRPGVRLGLLLALVALAAWAGSQLGMPTAQPASAQDAGDAGNGGVGVVDINRVYEESAAGKKFAADREAMVQASVAELTQMQTELKTLTDSIPELSRESQQFKDAVAKARELEAMLQVRQTLAQQAADALTRDSNLKIYNMVDQAIREVAQERGLDIVLRTADPIPSEADVAGAQSSQVRQVLINRHLVYHSPGSDITSAVIAKINAGGNGG